MRLQRTPIAVYQIPEEIQQFGLVVAVFRLAFNVLTDLINEFKHCRLIVEHGLVVIVHLLQEVNAAHVLADVVDQLRNVPLHQRLDLVEVLDKGDDEVVTEVEEF